MTTPSRPVKKAAKKAAKKTVRPRKQAVTATVGHDLGHVILAIKKAHSDGWVVRQIVEGQLNGDAGYLLLLDTDE